MPLLVLGLSVVLRRAINVTKEFFASRTFRKCVNRNASSYISLGLKDGFPSHRKILAHGNYRKTLLPESNIYGVKYRSN